MIVQDIKWRVVFPSYSAKFDTVKCLVMLYLRDNLLHNLDCKIYVYVTRIIFANSGPTLGICNSLLLKAPLNKMASITLIGSSEVMFQSPGVLGDNFVTTDFDSSSPPYNYYIHT